jgi:hypothetical protein
MLKAECGVRLFHHTISARVVESLSAAGGVTRVIVGRIIEYDSTLATYTSIRAYATF